MTTILAIETTTAACSTAVWCQGGGLSRFAVLGRGHAEALLPMIAGVLSDAGLDPRDLDALAVTRGPGAFTGLRIGLAAARGMAVALGRPCYGLTTLETLAAAAVPMLARMPGNPVLLAVLDTKRGDFYAQVFSAAGAPLGPAAVVAPADLAGVLSAAMPMPDHIGVAGDAGETAAAILTAAGLAAHPLAGCTWPHAEVLAQRVARLVVAGGAAGPAPSPFYLRAAETGPPLAPGSPAARTPGLSQPG